MLQHEILGRINDYDFALNISVYLVLTKSTSNQQGSTSLSPTHHTNAYKKYQLQCAQWMTNYIKIREYTITTTVVGNRCPHMKVWGEFGKWFEPNSFTSISLSLGWILKNC